MSAEPVDVTPAAVDADVATLPAPPAVVPAPASGRRLRARKVARVVRRVEPWSVLKVAGVLLLCVWSVLTVAGVILWQLARATGTLDNLEDFIGTAMADSSFALDGGSMLLASLTGGVVLVFAGTALAVLMAVIFNLVSEVTGGLRIHVVELETARPVDADAGSQVADQVR